MTVPRTAAPSPPTPRDNDAVRLLAATLEAKGFVGERLEEVAGGSGAALLPLPLVARRLDPEDPLGVLIALFLHGATTSLAEAERALRPLRIAQAEELGVVEVLDDGVSAALRLSPFGGLLLASDRVDIPLREFVMGAAGSTRTLAHLSLRRGVRSLLDVGTGSGVHALLGAAHAETVVGTDLNPRAVAFARFNAALNGVDNVEFVEGSWFEPVAGRRFDQIVSNPPFVIAPEGEFLFRDGCEGGVGDQVSRTLVEAAPSYLQDGGTGQFLLNWVHDPGASWSDPIRSWVADSGCDAWILHVSSDEAGRYAYTWNTHLTSKPAEHAATTERWLRWLDERGIEMIGFGLLTMRRSNGRSWFRADEMPYMPGPEAGSQLATTLDAHDVLSELQDMTDLLRARPVTNAAHQLEQILRFGDGRYEVEGARVRLRAPLSFTADVDVFAATLLTLLDGTRTLSEAIAIAAEILEDIPDDIETTAASLVASMIAMGLVRLGDLDLGAAQE